MKSVGKDSVLPAFYQKYIDFIIPWTAWGYKICKDKRVKRGILSYISYYVSHSCHHPLLYNADYKMFSFVLMEYER